MEMDGKNEKKRKVEKKKKEKKIRPMVRGVNCGCNGDDEIDLIFKKNQN